MKAANDNIGAAWRRAAMRVYVRPREMYVVRARAGARGKLHEAGVSTGGSMSGWARQHGSR